MTQRRPLVLVSGTFSELPQGDTVLGSAVTLAASPSGLILVGSDLGIDGVAIASGEAAQSTANTALASGNAALVDAGAALASGNAALVDLSSKVSKAGDVVSGTFAVTSQSYGEPSSTVGSGQILLDFSAANNFDVTLEGGSTLAPSVSPSGGQSGAILIRQDGTGSRLLSYSGGWSFANGSAPTLTLTPSGTDLLAYYCPQPSTIVGNLIAAVSGV
jgi:hypothetical protein